MKKFICLVAVLLMFVSTAQLVSAVTTDIKREAGYISLNTSKTKEVEPNIAKVTFAVENTANDAQSAAADNNAISNKIINALKSVTNAQTDVIKTANFSVRPVYSSTMNGKRVIKNYTAVNSVTVQTKDINKVASIIDKAIAAGANRTDDLIYSYENGKKVCSEIYPELMTELKNQAAALAVAGGTSLDGIKYINASCSSDSNIVSNGRYYAKSMLASDSSMVEEAAGAVVEAGKIKIRVYVNADFYVK